MPVSDLEFVGCLYRLMVIVCILMVGRERIVAYIIRVDIFTFPYNCPGTS